MRLLHLGGSCLARLAPYRDSAGVRRAQMQETSYATHFAFLAFTALILAQRAFTARTMFARPAADKVLLPPLPFAPLV